MMSDLALLERWRGGDRAAGQELFARHFADVYRFLEHKVGDAADDLTQRTFLACLAARDQFREEASFRTYLFAIARNEIHGYLRGVARAEQVDFDVTSIAQIVTSPSGRLERARKIEGLRAALRELPVDTQLLLELHYWHELDASALGEVFGTSAGTVRVRLLRARRALRDKLARFGPEALGEPRDPMRASLAEPDVDGAGGEER
jgi:RNA polymerase sigma-70 factor (ECF subfamily)